MPGEARVGHGSRIPDPPADVERTLTLRVEIPLRESDFNRLYEAGLRVGLSPDEITREALFAWLDKHDTSLRLGLAATVG
jgi:hypothetical protein